MLAQDCVGQQATQTAVLMEFEWQLSWPLPETASCFGMLRPELESSWESWTIRAGETGTSRYPPALYSLLLGHSMPPRTSQLQAGELSLSAVSACAADLPRLQALSAHPSGLLCERVSFITGTPSESLKPEDSNLLIKRWALHLVHSGIGLAASCVHSSEAC